jgi:branched-chain amino acid transport system ATP-binding protein
MNDPKTGIDSSRPILKVEAISKCFGGIQALYDITFEVPSGAIYSIIGPNGAGKTTLFNIITAVFPPDEGRIFYEEKPIHERRAHELVAEGIARTFQNVELFGSMTVLENVLVGRHVRLQCGFLGAIARWSWVGREEKEAREQAMELLRFVGLEDVAFHRSEDLPFGWQRFLEIARALASGPRLMLLDEPASGLNAVETQKLAELFHDIRARGVTMLLVEHDMSLTMGISDRILVLDQGRRLAEGTPYEIQKNEAVISAYLGKE